MKKEVIRRIVADTLEVPLESVEWDTDLTTFRTFDSVAVLTLMVSLDERAGIKLSPSDARDLKFVRDLERVATAQGIAVDA